MNSPLTAVPERLARKRDLLSIAVYLLAAFEASQDVRRRGPQAQVRARLLALHAADAWITAEDTGTLWIVRMALPAVESAPGRHGRGAGTARAT